MASAHLIALSALALGPLLLAALTSTCVHRDPGSDANAPPPAASSASASPSASAASSAATTPASGETSWVEAVRLEDWDRASSLLDGLNDEQRASGEIRYVRARVALARKQFPLAVGLLQGLESQLPELAADIAFHRAEAQLRAGPVDAAATYFASRSGVEELTKAATAFEQVGDPARARACVDRAIRASRKAHDERAVQAREVRARLAEAAGQKAQAVSDWKFVAQHSPFADQAEGAVEALRRLDPTQVPTAYDRLARAARLSDRGNPDLALDELERVSNAPGKSPSPAELAMARAHAVYKTRDRYDEAASLFEHAAKMRGAHAAEALYFAAKAWSRADRNERGLELYGTVASSFSRTPWAERASYQRARLLRLEGRWREAATAYEGYLARHRRGASIREARYEYALSLLLSGRPKDARARLTELAAAEDNRLDAAALRQLVGVAAEASGDTQAAAELWRSVIDAEPLSWPALVSAARLESIGQAPPPAIHPGPTSSQQPLTVALPRVAKLLHDLGFEADAEDRVAREEDAIAQVYGARSAEARCAAYRPLDRARRLYRVGQRVAPVDLVMVGPSSATRWAWDCLYPTPYATTIRDLERSESLPWGLVHAVMRQESGFNPDASSPVGAVGLMQLMPATARKTAARMQMDLLAEQVGAPAKNLAVGARYLAMLLEMFGGNVAMAVAAYNAGPRAVSGWASRAGDMKLDVFVAQIPFRETRRYVWRVVGNHARYSVLAHGTEGIPQVRLELGPMATLPADAY